MNLVLHQFRKDARQFRVLLAVWFGLLLLDLAVNLGWAGRVDYSPARGFDSGANTWTGLLPMVIWMLVVILPSLVVLTDSPARREGFLATRPLPQGCLLLAKMLFILGLIVAPWVLQELVYLVWMGLPGWVIGRGTLERLMFTLPVAAGFGAYAALWPGYDRWARSLAIVAGGYVVLGITMSLCLEVFHLNHIGPLDLSNGPGKAPPVVAAYAFVLALLAFAIWHSRSHRGALARWGGLLLIALISQTAVSSLWRWDIFQLRPADQPAANALTAAAGFDIPPRSLQLQRVQDTDSGQPYFNINLTPKIQPLPVPNVVEWAPKEATLLRAGGGEIHGGRPNPGQLFNENYWNNNYNPPDFVSWSAEFPPDILFCQNKFYVPGQSGDVQYSRFELPTSPAELTGPVTLEAGLEARVFQWRKIASLPLTPGATSTDEFGSWKFIAVQSDPSVHDLQFFLQRGQIELATAADSRCSSIQGGPLARMSVMVYDPLRHVAWLPDEFVFNAATRSTQSALAQYFAELEFNNIKTFSPEELARCRLIIFEKSWVGSVSEAWRSPAFTLDEKLPMQTAGLVMGVNNDPLPGPEFNRRVAALKVPAPDASRRDVSLYLLDFFRLLDARRYPLDQNDPHIRQLAAFVPTQLDLLLDGLSVMNGTSRNAVLTAIQLGATDAQKPAILAALQREPDLAEVLFARGWVDDARKEIYQLAQTEPSRPLPLSALRAIAWFHDPQTYPRLLEEFEDNPYDMKDDLLRTLPGLDAELDRIIARRWHEDSLVFSQRHEQMFGEPFSLALRHGQISALQRACFFLDASNFNQPGLDSTLAYAFEGAVQMPDVKPQDRQNYEVVMAWMRQHRPEDFVFNPALRQFVLKPGLATRSTAGNP